MPQYVEYRSPADASEVPLAGDYQSRGWGIPQASSPSNKVGSNRSRKRLDMSSKNRRKGSFQRKRLY